MNVFASPTWANLRALTLPPAKDRELFGVCAALGSATPIAAWMWRCVFLTTGLVWGVGVGAYIILAICIPDPVSDGG